MNTIQSYPAKFTQDDDGGILVTFPDLPEALTDGATLEAAYVEAADCLEEAIAGRISDGEDIPKPGKSTRNTYLIPLSAQFAMKVLMYQAWRESGMTKTELANRIGINEKEMRRMLDPHYGTKLSTMEKAMNTLGYRINIGLKKIA